MSNVFPPTRVGKIVFMENHVPAWAQNAVPIGTTSTAVASATTKTVAARAAYNAHITAQEQSKAATQAFYDAVKDMADAGSDIVKQVKAKAAVDGNAVYTLALLPVPAIPGPTPAPGTPYDFKATLNPDGTLKLSWKCANPRRTQGTIYQISRRVGSAGDFTVLGVSGARSYVDTTVPAGVASVMYKILATRTTSFGVAAEFVVNFGVSGGTTTATATAVPRMAA
ncbi:MAG: hypothetical protein QM813_06125 [Verrucomicrobiota bacterium]